MTKPGEAIAAVEQSLTDYLGSYQLPPGDIHNAAVIAVRDARPHLEAAVRERCAQRLDEYAGNYPEDVFPPDGTSKDAIGGTAMRHAYRNAGRLLREDRP